VPEAGPPTIGVQPTMPDCNSSNGALMVTSSTGHTPFTYTINGTSQTGSPSATFSGFSKGVYDIYVTDSYGCVDSLKFVLPENQGISDFTITPTPVVCNGSPGKIEIDSVMGASTSYTYTLDGVAQSSPVFSNVNAGPHTVIVSDDNGCQAIKTFDMAAGEFSCDATFQLSEDNTNIHLNTETPGSVKWLNGSGSVVASGSTADISPHGGGGIVVMQVTTPENCTCEKELVIPLLIVPTNVFSPNDDGVNDTWRIKNIESFPDCEVYLYSRWGQRIFYSKGYTEEWNGEYLGAAVPASTYYYIINLNNGLKPFKSFVTVVR
jgi:gliding motility-associated-like protein